MAIDVQKDIKSVYAPYTNQSILGSDYYTGEIEEDSEFDTPYGTRTPFLRLWEVLIFSFYRYISKRAFDRLCRSDPFRWNIPIGNYPFILALNFPNGLSNYRASHMLSCNHYKI